MGATSPESLSTAGGLLVASGFLAAFVGGVHGLQSYRPGLVVLSVLLVMGYGAAGHLLMSRRDAAFTPAAVTAGALAVPTLWLFQAGVTPLFGRTLTLLVLFPLLACLVTLAGAHLAAYAFARRHGRVPWPRRDVSGVAAPLQIAGLAPVVGAFVLAHVDPARGLGTPEATLVLLSSLLAGGVCSAGGVLASVKRHPRFALLGGAAGFSASALYLFAFAPLGPEAFTGQLIALAGLLLAAFPLVTSALAWAALSPPGRDTRPPVDAAPGGQADAGSR